MSTLVVAFLGGVLTIFAPCGAMLLPSFFAWSFASPGTMLRRTAQFTLGLMVGVVPLGIAVGGIGSWVRLHTEVFTQVLGVAVILFGLAQFFSVTIPVPTWLRWPRDKKALGGDTRDRSSASGVFFLGVGYSLAAVGCSGPILGSVLALTAYSSSGVWSGALHLGVYALGMAVPVVLLAFLWDRARLGERSWLRPRPVKVLGRHTTWGNLVSGLVMIVLGIVLLLFAGGFGLPSLISTGTQIDLEKNLIDWASAIPWTQVAVIAAALVIVGGLAYGAWRLARGPAASSR